MFTLIIVIIFALLAVAAIVAAFLTEEKGWAVGLSAVFLLSSAAFLIGGMYNRVETKHIGIETVYGKPTGKTYEAGLHWLAPWKTIQEWDATRQSYNHLGDRCEKPGDGSIWVSIKGQRQACIRVQINWETTTKTQATKNWSTYKEVGDLSRFQVFTDREVDPGFNDAILSTFRDFDPLALVDPKTGEAQSPDLAGTYTVKLQQAIDQRLGDRNVGDTHSDADIKVMSLNWGLIGYDDPTTKQISNYAQKVLEGRNLDVDSKNAAKRKSIAGASGISPQVQACLDLVKTTGRGEPGLCLTGGQVALTRSVG